MSHPATTAGIADGMCFAADIVRAGLSMARRFGESTKCRLALREDPPMADLAVLARFETAEDMRKSVSIVRL